MIVDCVFPSSSDVYSLKKPSNKISIHVNGAVSEAALCAYAYTPTTVPLPSRDDAAKMRTPEQKNHDWHLPVESSRKAWAKAGNFPQYVVLVKEEMVNSSKKKVTNFKNATIYLWRPGIVAIKGVPADWDFQVIGALTGDKKEDVYLTDETVTIRVDNPYTGDSFTVSLDGHYVGNDNYIVPKTFAEFYEKNPNYVRRWASKWLKKPEDSDEVRDWEQELLLYLHYLPETSKSRKPSDRHPKGCTDVIQCFDPYRQYGASERRFRNYLNICLHNRSLTMVGRQSKNPVYRRDNVIFGGDADTSDDVFLMDDEYIHKHSQVLSRRSEEECAHMERRMLVKHFMMYVLDEQPELYDTVLAISESGTLREAMEVLKVDEATFTRNRKRIIQLKDAFMDGGPVQKQRKPYKKRIKLQGALLPVGVSNENHASAVGDQERDDQ